jgi:integrase
MRSGNWQLRLRGETYTVPDSEHWNEEDARREVARYAAQLDAGVFAGFPNARVVTDARGRLFEEAAKDYLAVVARRSRNKRAAPGRGLPANRNDKQWRINHLLSFFRGRRVSEVTLDLIASYTDWKLDESKAIEAKRAEIKGRLAEAKAERRRAGLAARSIRDDAARAQALLQADEAQRRALSPEDRAWWVENCNRKGLDASSINKTLQTLGTILEREMKRQPGVLAFNWARDEDARLDENASEGFALNLDQVEAFLESAREMDAANRRDRQLTAREALFAFGLFTGARVSEQMDVRLRDLDRRNGHVFIPGTKTDAARGRRVPIHPGLRDPLWRYLEEHRRGAKPDEYLFVSNSGAQRTKDRYNELIARTVPRANELLAARDQRPLPERFTSHAFRRSYVTAMAELGENQAEIMRRVGHASAAMINEIYNKVGATGRMANDPRLIALFGERGYDGFGSIKKRRNKAA